MNEMERVPTLTKEPKRKKRKTSRIILTLGWIFFLGLSTIMFLQSSLSKVDQIEVTGLQLLEPSQVVQLSKIQKGASFFTVQSSDIEQAIGTLPEVKEVEVARHFPGNVSIQVTEYEHVLFIMENEKKIIPILENGTRLENRLWNDRVIDRPILRNWKEPLQLPKLGEELKKLDKGLLNQISEIEPDVRANDPQRLILYMKDGYEVHTSIRHFSKNMAWYPSFVANLKQEGNQKGIIMLLDGKWFIPYVQPANEEEGTA